MFPVLSEAEVARMGRCAMPVAEAELGERIVRALILRRVSLIESGAGGPVLELLVQYGATRECTLVVLVDGAVLHNPSEELLARRLGMTDSDEHNELFDVAVVGSGPAGLATAVYAAPW